jgi:transposase
MARAYSDDLRLRVLDAYERGEGSCRVLAARFGVSWEYVRKIVRQQALSGQRHRVPQSRFGPQSRVTDRVMEHLLALVQAQPDITIEALRERLATEAGVQMSWTLTQNWTRRLDLRLKKSRSTPSNAIPPPTASGELSSTRRS